MRKTMIAVTLSTLSLLTLPAFAGPGHVDALVSWLLSLTQPFSVLLDERLTLLG